MKFIVFGGAGDMGSRCVEDLAARDEVTRVTLADNNITLARQIAEKVSRQGIEVDAREVDANDYSGLVKAMRGYDAAASALGPFYLFESRLVQAAIEAGVDYCSICDDWDATEAVLEQFHEEAKKKGVTVVTCLGASPGISNISISSLAREMDTARKAEVYCFLPLDAGGGAAALKHGLHIMSGEIVTWSEGRRRMVKACSEARVIAFPGVGKKKVWLMGHSEPATVGRFIPGIEEVSFYMGFGPVTPMVVYPARWGWFKSERRIDSFVRAIQFLERLASGPEPGLGALRIDVWGEKDGDATNKMICGTGQMREMTGLSLSIGALMLGKKEILTADGGVYAPEAILDPDIFFTYFKETGSHQIYTDLQMTQPLKQ